GGAGEPLSGAWGAPLQLADARGDESFGRTDLQHLMWSAAGLSRDAAGLRDAVAILGRWAAPAPTDAKGAEDANLLLVARAVVASALVRTESRGGHFRRDFPATDPALAVHSTLVGATHA